MPERRADKIPHSIEAALKLRSTWQSESSSVRTSQCHSEVARDDEDHSL